MFNAKILYIFFFLYLNSIYGDFLKFDEYDVDVGHWDKYFLFELNDKYTINKINKMEINELIKKNLISSKNNWIYKNGPDLISYFYKKKSKPILFHNEINKKERQYLEKFILEKGPFIDKTKSVNIGNGEFIFAVLKKENIELDVIEEVIKMKTHLVGEKDFFHIKKDGNYEKIYSEYKDAYDTESIFSLKNQKEILILKRLFSMDLNKTKRSYSIIQKITIFNLKDKKEEEIVRLTLKSKSISEIINDLQFCNQSIYFTLFRGFAPYEQSFQIKIDVQ